MGGDGVSQMISDGPSTHLGAVELKGVKPEGFGSSKAVGARWRAGQPFSQQVQDGLRPGSGVVAAGQAGDPEGGLFLRAGPEVLGGECIEPAGGNAELLGCRSSIQGALPEGVEHMADK